MRWPSLALAAVALTVAAVALSVRWLVPDMPWAAAIALGAIVAPPDAAAATAVLRQLRPPHRLLVILEGESLFNDASALLIYRLAVGAAVAGAISAGEIVSHAAARHRGQHRARRRARPADRCTIIPRIQDVATSVIVQFVRTFAVWIAGRGAPPLGHHHDGGVSPWPSRAERRTTIPARIRIPSYAVWEVAVFLLNSLAFILVGLQLKPIVSGLSRAELGNYSAVAAAVCAAVILTRIAWATGAHLLRGPHTSEGRRHTIVVAWCGMRGTVTLAAALALPGNFPHRELILLTAFLVVLGTLVVQGLTLKPLMIWLRIEPDDEIEREVRLARLETLRAGVAALEQAHGAGGADLVKQKYRVRLRRAEAQTGGRQMTDGGAGVREHADAVRTAMAAERQRLSALRNDGTIGDDAYHRVEEELDRAEWSAEAMEPE